MSKLKIVIAITLSAMALLWYNVINFNEVRKEKIRENWMITQFEMAKITSNSIKIYVEHLKADKKLTDNDYLIAFHKIIDPIKILNNGNAWIYSQHKVLYDPEIFPFDKFKNKDTIQIFKEQEKNGAKEYEKLLSDILIGASGKGYYIWTKEKGRECGAWVSSSESGQTWTIGITTPESEIFEISDLHKRFLRECIFSLIITVLLFLYVFYFYKSEQQRKKDLKDTSSQLSSVISSIDDSLKNLKEIDEHVIKQ